MVIPHPRERAFCGIVPTRVKHSRGHRRKIENEHERDIGLPTRIVKRMGGSHGTTAGRRRKYSGGKAGRVRGGGAGCTAVAAVLVLNALAANVAGFVPPLSSSVRGGGEFKNTREGTPLESPPVTALELLLLLPLVERNFKIATSIGFSSRLMLNAALSVRPAKPS